MKITKSSGNVFADIGFDSVEANALAANYVDKILKGAKPAGLPASRPSSSWC